MNNGKSAQEIFCALNGSKYRLPALGAFGQQVIIQNPTPAKSLMELKGQYGVLIDNKFHREKLRPISFFSYSFIDLIYPSLEPSQIKAIIKPKSATDRLKLFILFVKQCLQKTRPVDFAIG